MKNVQKVFTIKLKTNNIDIDRDCIKELINNSIINSKYSDDLTYSIDKNAQLLFNFLESTMAISYFISSTKEDFLAKYPYFAEEYDFCLAEFNKNPQEVLLNFLENTSTPELTEPYGLTPEDFSFCVEEYIQNNFSKKEQKNFLKEVTKRGLKLTL